MANVKAFAYLRVSGKDQVKGDGFTRQLQTIRAYAKASGIAIAAVYREEGISGTLAAEDRPAWAQLAEGVALERRQGRDTGEAR